MAIRGGRSGGPGGGGRSHFGGSSSSGRSHSSSRSSGGHYRMGRGYHRGGMVFHFHGILGPGSAFFITSSFLLLFIVGLLIGIFANFTALETIEKDYYNYQTMIENTMNNSAYRREALVTGKYEGEGGKWYIRYEYDLDTINDRAYDESFPHYTKEQLANYIVGQTKIIIVTEEPVVSEYTVTIPLDYYKSGIENDGEYIATKSEIKTMAIALVCMSGITALLIFFGVKKCIKAQKNETAKIDENKSIQQKTHTKCPYCGARVSLNASNCPKCGAGINE